MLYKQNYTKPQIAVLTFTAKCGIIRAVAFPTGTAILSRKESFRMNNNNNIIRFLLTFFLGFIGSLIINHTSLKPEGYTSRTLAYFFLSMVTFGIYPLVASICNLFFDPAKPKNIGYAKK